ncbi:MAG: hypothetical protein LC137_07950 [Burkholderiales bacterium]|nr:hypothetical protein [Burkholderiales bacterium]
MFDPFLSSTDLPSGARSSRLEKILWLSRMAPALEVTPSRRSRAAVKMERRALPVAYGGNGYAL